MRASTAIKNGAKFIGTNPDNIYTLNHINLPDSGSFISMI